MGGMVCRQRFDGVELAALGVLKELAGAVIPDVLPLAISHPPQLSLRHQVPPGIDEPPVPCLLAKLIDPSHSLHGQHDAPTVLEGVRGRDLGMDMLSGLQGQRGESALFLAAHAQRNGVHPRVSQDLFVARIRGHLPAIGERRAGPFVQSDDGVTDRGDAIRQHPLQELQPVKPTMSQPNQTHTNGLHTPSPLFSRPGRSPPRIQFQLCAAAGQGHGFPIHFCQL